MDKRIWFITIFMLVISLSIFSFRKFSGKDVKVSYTISQTEVNIGDSITYNDLTPGATRWKWDFGDNEYSTLQTGKHAYSDGGPHTIKLTVYGSFGTLQDPGKSIVINNTAPVATPAVKEALITGTGSADANKEYKYECKLQAAAYEWALQNDPTGHVQKGAVATYSFHNPGMYTILLKTHNPDKEDQKTITVTGAPVAAAHPVPQPAKHHHAAASGGTYDLPSEDGPSVVKPK